MAAAAAVASKPSPKGSPCSCLAGSYGIPGSVPSDCRLAPLPPSLTHTYTQTSPISRSPLIFSASLWANQAFYMTTAAPVAVPVHLAHVHSPSSPSPLDILPTLHLLLFACPWSPRVFFFFPSAFLCQWSECLVLRGTPSSNPVVLTGGRNSTTQLSTLACVLHIDTHRASPLQTAAYDVAQPATTSKHRIKKALV